MGAGRRSERGGRDLSPESAWQVAAGGEDTTEACLGHETATGRRGRIEDEASRAPKRRERDRSGRQTVDGCVECSPWDPSRASDSSSELLSQRAEQMGSGLTQALCSTSYIVHGGDGEDSGKWSGSNGDAADGRGGWRSRSRSRGSSAIASEGSIRLFS